jgi:hypothetical protein
MTEYGVHKAMGPDAAARDVSSDCDCPPVSADGALEFIVPPKSANPSPAYGYVLERIRLSPDALARVPLAKILDDYRFAIRSSLSGWSRVLACGAISGDPYTFVQLWRVSGSVSPADSLLALQERGGEAYRQFLTALVEFDRELLFPTSYDPNPHAVAVSRGPVSRDAVVLVYRAVLRRGALARLACLKERFFVPRLTGVPSEWAPSDVRAPVHGWRLLASATSVTGRHGVLVQVWRLPDSNSLVRAMRVMSENEVYRRNVAPCIESEEHVLYEQLLGD